MTNPRDAAEDFQAQWLEGIRKSQAAVVDGLRSWTETVQQLVPQQTAWAGSEQLPSPTELVDSVFDFAAQLLNAQREFAHSVLGATTSIGERAREEAEKTAQQAQKATKGS